MQQQAGSSFLQCLTPTLLTGSDVILASASSGLQLHLLIVQVYHHMAGHSQGPYQSRVYDHSLAITSAGR